MLFYVLNADRRNSTFHCGLRRAIQRTDFFWLSQVGRPIAIVKVGTTALEGGHDALDDLCHPAGHVAIGYGYVLHAGWVYSHPADPGDCCCPDTRHPGPYAGLGTDSRTGAHCAC